MGCPLEQKKRQIETDREREMERGLDCLVRNARSSSMDASLTKVSVLD